MKTGEVFTSELPLVIGFNFLIPGSFLDRFSFAGEGYITIKGSSSSKKMADGNFTCIFVALNSVC